jgi:phosphohistidine phosphatase
MQTLILLRHAKSSWDSQALADFDRPLNERGLRDAPRMGKELARHKILPDLVLCSPARRARQTLELFKGPAGLTTEPVYEPRIYNASSRDLLEVLHELPDQHACVMLLGHNPGLEDLFARLTERVEHLPTAALTCLELTADSWRDTGKSRARMKWFLTPKGLRGEKRGGKGGQQG